jgi:hypothetical protein
MADVLCKTAVLLNASEWCAEREQEEAAAALVGCKKDSNYDNSSFIQTNNDNSSSADSSSGHYDDLQGSIQLAEPSEGTNGADALIAAIAACSTPSVYYSSSSAGQHTGSRSQYEHYDPTDPFAVRVKQEHSSETASNSASASASASESPRLGSSSPHYQQQQQQGRGAVAPKLLGGLLDSLVSFASQELMIMKDDDDRSDDQQSQSHSHSPERRSGGSRSSSSSAAAGAAAPSGRGAHRQLPQTYHDDGTPRVRYNRPRSISNPEGMDNASWRGVTGGRGAVTSSDYNLRGHQYNYLSRGADIAVIKVSAQRVVFGVHLSFRRVTCHACCKEQRLHRMAA